MEKRCSNQKKTNTNMQKPCMSEKNKVLLDNEVPPPKKESGPVPPPNFTLEQLLANIPEPDLKTLKSNSSQEVDTGEPIGKEEW